MSGYGYGPPPPPPAAAPGYSHAPGPYNHQAQGRGGGAGQNGRGRGGQYPRGRDYRGPSQPHFDYSQQAYQGQPAYGAPHPPAAGSYIPHWTPDQGHAPQGTHPHAPAPLSAANYHPNYVTQPYTPHQTHPSSYGPAQPYSHPFSGHSGPPSWPAQSPPQPPSFSGHRGRGGHSERSGPKPGVHGRPAHHHTAPPPVAAGSYGQPFHQDPRALHYPPAHFPYGAPPPPSAGRHDSHRGSHVRRGGRGGGHREHNIRGRGGHGGQGKHGGANHHGGFKGRENKQVHHGENKPKPETPSVGKKKKRKVNTLGLTPGVDSETEDDEGEEKALTDLIGAEAVQISDVSSFLAERRKNFPTKSRVEARKAAESARKDEDKTAELEKQADKLRRQLRKVESSIKRKRDQGDEGDEMRDPADESSADEKPEVLSSRKPVGASHPSPAKKADITRHCKYYSTGGICGKKGKCRFVHDPKVREAAIKEREANNGRLTIQQRLILNDKEQEDLAVLQSIQYLRQKGLMSGSAEDADEEADEPMKDSEDAVPVPASEAESSLPPAATPSPPSVRQEKDTPLSASFLAATTAEGDSNQADNEAEHAHPSEEIVEDGSKTEGLS